MYFHSSKFVDKVQYPSVDFGVNSVDNQATIKLSIAVNVDGLNLLLERKNNK